MNKTGGIFAYAFWIGVGFVFGVFISWKFLCKFM